ncbi:Guanine nucleotide-binding protein, beta subunit [Trema orientale]|uniref:Guanine nucleotide-binding protein, beta subunit n=1 Tax=Trema orientale TaxID=63057 RepID=A0A2P5ETL1_TREOI|nr:Guanine nucleotide-binding protein, beta subunit [Trema orientale]
MQVLIYDLRSSHPIQVKDHMYDSPILGIKWHRVLGSRQPKLITADKHIVKIWDSKTGDGMTSIEPAAGTINDICVFDDTGLMLLALDGSQIPAYFLPALGPAPKWSPRLQQWEELELEGNKEAFIYDKTKFLTKEDLDKLNLTNLIGTDLVRASMHGYFVDYSVYMKAKELADPSSYDKYIEQRRQEKLEKELATRIATKRKLPKVNRILAKQIVENEEAENAKKDADDEDIKRPSKKKKALSSDIFKDERFMKMFEHKDFEIDELSQEYLALHPVASSKKQPSLVEEHFEPVFEDEDQSDSDASPVSNDDPNNEKTKTKGRVPRLHEVKDERHAEAFFNRTSLANEDSLPLGERLASLNDNPRPSSGIPNGVKFGPGGSREISFLSRSSAKYVEDEEEKGKRGGRRRGIGPLGLKSTFGGRGRGGRGGRGGHRGRGRRGRR